MTENNKENLIYFESVSMRGLFESMEDWQVHHQKRLLSTQIHKDEGKFCCIALSNPTEVIICTGTGSEQARVHSGYLHTHVDS